MNYHLSPGDFQLFHLPAHSDENSTRQRLLRHQPLPTRPLRTPSAAKITHVRGRHDAIPPRWVSVPPGHSLAQLGLYQSGFSYYKLSIVRRSANAAPGGDAALSISLPAQDSAVTRIKGEIALPLGASGTPAILPLRRKVPIDTKVICLYENSGHPDNGPAMQTPFGITDAGLVPFQASGELIRHWRLRLVDLPHGLKRLPEVEAHFNDSTWQKINVSVRPSHQFGRGQAAVLRTRINLSEADIRQRKTILRFYEVSPRLVVCEWWKQALLSWFRMEFVLPAMDDDI